MIDYLDEDLSYLLGLIVARGNIREDEIKQIVIEFPFKGLTAIGIQKEMQQKESIKLSLLDVRKRIEELTDSRIRQEENPYAVYMIIESMKNTIFWRNIRTILGRRVSYSDFEVPEFVLGADTSIKKEFIRGFADIAGSARASNNDWSGRHRIYIDILNNNWRLPIQLCNLLQEHLHIPVQTITYGHPNTRDPNLVEYNQGREEAWTREHQLKVYADNFLEVGFYIKHKQEILEELADFNLKKFGGYTKLCWPYKTIRRPSNPHPEEYSERLPQELRGKHFDTYWQICCELGCERCKKQQRLVSENVPKWKVTFTDKGTKIDKERETEGESLVEL